jgi:UDP-N-acetylmuramyl pentapeptide phosphotransferase/UDP-N-acetylglucosamine-1-phosphate transferase
VITILIYLLVFILTYIGVEFFRRWSLRKKLFDIPNERSSHSSPTPRGGGLIVVLITLAAFVFYLIYFSHQIPIYFLSGVILIASISWIDDLYSISFGWRFLIHSITAILAIVGLGFWDIVYIPFWGNLTLGPIGYLITFCWIVWLTNAFNFMDGIDGIAGIHAFSAGLGWLIISQILGFEIAGILGGILAISSFAFLLHNWEPAKIFMGDVCSAFLGFSFAVMPLLAKTETEPTNQTILPIISVMLVWFFVFDSLITFIKRLFRREKVWEAHREHIYQQLIINGFSHQTVSLIYGFISMILIVLIILWLYYKSPFGFILGVTTIFLSILLLLLTRKKKKM